MVSFPENIEDIAQDWNCFPVNPTERPVYNAITHNLAEKTPIFSDGKYIQVWEIVEYSLEQAKANKLALIDSEWYSELSNGWNSGQGKLGLESSDVALLSANFSLAKEAANLGYPIPPIITMDNQEITFSDIQSLTMFMLQYGEYRSSLSKTFASRRRAVADATTLAQVDEA